MNQHYRNACRFLILLFVASLFLNGCRGGKTAEKSPKTMDQQHEDHKSFVLPLKLEEGSFYTACGWLDDETIVYITELKEGARVYSYHLTDGKNKLLYQSEYPIVDVQISPSRKYLLIHLSPSMSEAELKVTDADGEVLVSKKIPSRDLTYEWNPFDEDRILVSSFTEDWDFSVYELNLFYETLEEVSVPQPFAYWIGENELIYLNWDQDEPELFADLYKYDLSKNEKQKMMSNIYQIHSFGRSFMAISVDEENEEQSVYTFYSNDFKKLSSFHAPLLFEYSDWFIPYYDANEDKRIFASFVPHYSAQSDTYADPFTLVVMNYETGKKGMVLENMENEPILLSPDGDYCLYGHFLEKILNVKTNEILSLVEK